MGVFNKTIIPLALVGYEIIDSQLCATRLVGYLSSYPTRARGVNVSYIRWCKPTENNLIRT